jgi:hypothetical protein
MTTTFAGPARFTLHALKKLIRRVGVHALAEMVGQGDLRRHGTRLSREDFEARYGGRFDRACEYWQGGLGLYVVDGEGRVVTFYPPDQGRGVRSA